MSFVFSTKMPAFDCFFYQNIDIRLNFFLYFLFSYYWNINEIYRYIPSFFFLVINIKISMSFVYFSVKISTLFFFISNIKIDLNWLLSSVFFLFLSKYWENLTIYSFFLLINWYALFFSIKMSTCFCIAIKVSRLFWKFDQITSLFFMSIQNIDETYLNILIFLLFIKILTYYCFFFLSKYRYYYVFFSIKISRLYGFSIQWRLSFLISIKISTKSYIQFFFLFIIILTFFCFLQSKCRFCFLFFNQNIGIFLVFRSNNGCF